MSTELTDALKAVLDLQHQWTAAKTPAMDTRGELIRSRLPNLLRSLADERHLEVYGSSGAGSNNRVPWVRIFNPDFSPSPQEGWYVVFLFAADGSAVYISLIQGTTDWAKGRGAKRDPAILAARSEQARSLLRQSGLSLDGLLENIQLNDPDLGKGYERGTAFAIRYPSDAVPPDETAIADVSRMLGLLEYVYSKQATADTVGQTDPLIADERGGEDEIDEQGIAGRPQHTNNRVWVYAPGPKARYWEEFYREGIMAVGGDELGDFGQYPTQEDVTNKIIEVYERKGRPVNDSLGYFQFANSIEPGDRVIAKKGLDVIVGYGVVTGKYEYRPDRGYYKHVRTVRWDGRGAWKCEGFPVKALTDITASVEFVAEIYRTIGLDDESSAPAPPVALPPYTVEQALNGVAFDAGIFEGMLRVWQNKKNLILQGPPGVGKTYLARRLAYALIGYELPSRVGMVQFHQSYAYEDFIQGYRPKESGFERRDGVFVRFCNKAKADQESRYVFIIDEINRGNISKVFGELLMLVEKDYRGSKNSVTLTYSALDDEQFYVPDNVFILGMMNTADRSLALVDYALRRRFAFERLAPMFGHQSFTKFLRDGGAEAAFVGSLSARLVDLNAEISNDPNLGPGFCLGHSYFCRHGVALTTQDYFDAVRNEIMPLLEEYWVDDRDRLEKWANRLLATF